MSLLRHSTALILVSLASIIFFPMLLLAFVAMALCGAIEALFAVADALITGAERKR